MAKSQSPCRPASFGGRARCRVSGRSVPAVAVMVLAFYGSSSGVSAVNCNDDGYIKPDILAHKTFTAISGGIYFLTHGSSGNLHTPDCAAALPAINAFLRTMHSTCQQIPPLWCSGKSSGVAPTMMCHGSDIKLVGGYADCTKLQAFLNQVMTASTLDALLADAGVENVWKTMRRYSIDDPDFFEKLTALSDARLEQAQAAFLPFTPETPVERAEYTASLEESAADFKNNRMSSIEAGVAPPTDCSRRIPPSQQQHCDCPRCCSSSEPFSAAILITSYRRKQPKLTSTASWRRKQPPTPSPRCNVPLMR